MKENYHIICHYRGISLHLQHNDLQNPIEMTYTKHLINASELARRAGVHEDTATKFLKDQMLVRIDCRKELNKALHQGTLELDPNFNKNGHWLRIQPGRFGGLEISLYYKYSKEMDLASAPNKKEALQEVIWAGEDLIKMANELMNE